MNKWFILTITALVILVGLLTFLNFEKKTKIERLSNVNPVEFQTYEQIGDSISINLKPDTVTYIKGAPFINFKILSVMKYKDKVDYVRGTIELKDSIENIIAELPFDLNPTLIHMSSTDSAVLLDSARGSIGYSINRLAPEIKRKITNETVKRLNASWKTSIVLFENRKRILLKKVGDE